MKREPKIKIRFGKILIAVQTLILSPILLSFVVIGTACSGVLTGWERYRHWLCSKLDTRNKK